MGAGAFAEVHDPGLDPVGFEQARDLAARLGPLGPLPLVTSPLRRTRETATTSCPWSASSIARLAAPITRR